MSEKCLDAVQKCGIFGVSQIMAQIKNASVVIHGPKGCVFPAYEASIESPLNIAYTEMCRKSTVFGGEADAVEKVKDEYYDNLPQIMAIVTTCASEIIGEDINGIINSANLDIPIISIEGGSFNNSHIDGLNIAMVEVVKKICNKKSNTDNCVNIFSTVGRSYTWKDDVKYLSELLSDFEINSRQLFLDASIEEVENYSNACLNVIIDKNYGVPCAKYMKKKFGIPYIIVDYPIGMKNTEAFIKKIADEINLDNSYVEKLNYYKSNTRKLFRKSLSRVNTFRYFEDICKLNKVIVGYESSTVALLETLVNEMEDNVNYVIIKVNNDEGEKQNIIKKISDISPNSKVVVTNDRSEIIKIIGENNFDVILGSDVEYYAANNKSSLAYINIEYPGARELHIASKNYVGYKGLLNFIEDYYNKIINVKIY